MTPAHAPGSTRVWARPIDPTAPLRGPRCVGQGLCVLGLVGGGPVVGELVGGEPLVGGVWSVDVVVDAVVFDEDLCFEERVELPAVEEFVA